VRIFIFTRYKLLELSIFNAQSSIITFYNYLKGKDCKVFPDETDLCLNNPNEPINISDFKKTIVPDLFVVCDNKFELVGNNIVCIPDFICEIVSPSSIKIDNSLKK